LATVVPLTFVDGPVFREARILAPQLPDFVARVLVAVPAAGTVKAHAKFIHEGTDEVL